MTFNRIQAALEATQLSKKYCKKFKDTKITDKIVCQFLERPASKCKLKEVMKNTGHLNAFLKAFEELELSGEQEDKENQIEKEKHFKSVQSPPEMSSTVNSRPLMTDSQLFKNTGAECFEKDPAISINEVEELKIETDFHAQASTQTDNNRTGVDKENIREDLDIEDPLIQSHVVKVNCKHQSANKPVQIIELALNENRGVAGVNRLIFKREKLQAILSKVGDEPVALVTITGPSRYGKSFILSYVVKYLQSITSPTADSNWMLGTDGQNDEPLSLGFPWKAGKEPETMGIWMWPEPLVIKAKDGNNLNLILVDTQGVFDSHTDRKDWATIVGLSLLTSSCLILNVLYDLQEDTLNALKEFMDFGLMANTRDSNEKCKPFQKIIFLIRDWNLIDDHKFGSQGGQEYIQWVLKQKNIETGKQIRNQIQECFDDIDCFLMPSPGITVNMKAYSGSVAGMDPQFAIHVKLFAEYLFHISQLSPKQICAETVTGDMLFRYFEKFVGVFNSNQMPSPNDLNEAHITVFNQIVVDNCLADYKNLMQKHLAKTPFVATDNLQQLHTRALSTAIENFEKARKMGGSCKASKFKSILQLNIEDEYKQLYDVNLRNRENCVKKEIASMQAYHAQAMEESKIKVCHLLDDFLLPNVFEEISTICLERTKQKLAQNLHFSSFSLLTENEEKYFMECLRSWEATLEIVNNFRQCIADKNMQASVLKCTLAFKSKFKQDVKNNSYWNPADFKVLQQNARSCALECFSSVYSSSLLYEQGNELLRGCIKTEFQVIGELVGERNRNFLTQCSTAVADVNQVYRDKMMDCILNLEGVDMAATHKREFQSSVNSLQNFGGFNKLPPYLAKQFESKLHNDIQQSYIRLIEEWFPQKSQILCKKYKNEMLAFCETHLGSIKALDEHVLLRKHENEKSYVLQEFKLFTNFIPRLPKTRTNLTQSIIFKTFEHNIEQILSFILNQNQLRIAALKPAVDGYFVKAKLKFNGIKDQINKSFLDTSAYFEKLEAARKSVIEEFRTECTINMGAVPIDNKILELTQFMSRFTEIKSVGPHILELCSYNLYFSKERELLENYENPSDIWEVRWIARNKIVIDDNLSGTFWNGKNVILYTNNICVTGSLRVINVSGKDGSSVTVPKPSPPVEPAIAGKNGLDGQPGDHSGNITILANNIDNPTYICLIANGGYGGRGHDGGNGSPGNLKGLDGNRLCQMSLHSLTDLFPSPVNCGESNIAACISKCFESLNSLATSEVKSKKVLGHNSKYWELDNNEGIHVQCGFYGQGSKSFYVWFKGAPGTTGQPGGLGGFAGRGGNPGDAGKIQVSIKYEKDIMMRRYKGVQGSPGNVGDPGANALDGDQGEDYVIIDPYCGETRDLLSFTGNLEILPLNASAVSRNFTRFLRWFTNKPLVEAAFCPYRKEYITFIDSPQPRPLLNQYGPPKQPMELQQLPTIEKHNITNPEEIVRRYGEFYSDPDIRKTGSIGYDCSANQSDDARSRRHHCIIS